MALQAVAGTVCMALLQQGQQGPPPPVPPPADDHGGHGGGGRNVSSLDSAANIVRDGLRWLYARRRYIRIADYNMDELAAARRQLDDTLCHVRGTIAEARNLGFLPYQPAVGWIRDGEIFMDDADNVLRRFEDMPVLDTTSIASFFPLCCDPCYALSRFVINSEAVTMLRSIKKHIALGVIPTTRYEKVTLSTFTEVRSVPESRSRENLPVLVRVKAPMYTQQRRAPIDLVMVLGISARMTSGLQQLKQGAMFAILNLRKNDRLFIVTPGRRAGQLSEFKQMSNNEQKRAAIAAVESLEATEEGAGMAQGLKEAYQVLCNRSERLRVGGIILLADGKDIQILKESQSKRKSFEESDKDIALRRQFPTYTFGFGADHDPRTLYYLGCEGYGTYSFVNESLQKVNEGLQKDNESLQNIKDAMALCIGGLTSISAQDVEIIIKTTRTDVKITDIKKGLYEADLISNKLGRIHIKDLFCDEEKHFIVYVDILEGGANSGSTESETTLLTVTAEYSNPLIKEKRNRSNMRRRIRADEAQVYLERPQIILGQGSHVPCCSPEVAMEIYRVHVLDRVCASGTKLLAAVIILQISSKGALNVGTFKTWARIRLWTNSRSCLMRSTLMQSTERSGKRKEKENCPRDPPVSDPEETQSAEAALPRPSRAAWSPAYGQRPLPQIDGPTRAFGHAFCRPPRCPNTRIHFVSLVLAPPSALLPPCLCRLAATARSPSQASGSSAETTRSSLEAAAGHRNTHLAGETTPPAFLLREKLGDFLLRAPVELSD
ncbi:hypothetical protein PR202_ga18114 [Eleusine coracana subsp. coracana]|uniref:VWFA domain-containing protein n=1 Tax=Eleusine coracana subsp. coracana TaxID=191504 RepID=A0AAV5CS93_ELECO|nr:hypothetical protein PR202_ga18114 [Eleusine coracana subsp. coracana]